MRNQLIVALLTLSTAGPASAQVAGSFGGDTNALLSNPPAVEVAASDGNVTSVSQSEPAIDETNSLSVDPTIGETLSVGLEPGLSDKIAVDVGENWSFVDPDAVRLQGEALFQEMDLLRGNRRGSAVYFGRDKDVQFVESHPNRPGIPAPVGASYAVGQTRFAIFAEAAPILDSASTTSVGWGGGLGIRFPIGR